ncbi:MAG: phage tail tube protein [Solirubrobacteraceae bacterium]|nr:phage tail tube protein [Solirubrobacteraceae bacterium]
MGYRFVAVGTDANSNNGGSTLDFLTNPGPIAYPSASTYFPVTAGNVDPGYEDRDRNDEVRGRRATAAPYPWRAAPTFTFSCRLYPELAKWLFPRLVGGTATAAGTAPVAVTTAFKPVGYSAILPSSTVTLVRDDQIDYLWGVWIASAEVTVGSDGDALVSVTGRALYHETVALTVETFTPDTSTFVDPYAGVMLEVADGAVGSSVTAIACVSSFGFSFDNTLSDDDDVRYCKGKNVLRELAGTRYRYRHYPTQHRLGRQSITGNLGFGTVMPTYEERRLLTEARRLRATLTGNPAGTTPPSDELLRFTFPAIALTGGGPDELQEDGEIKASYEWSGHFDIATGNDFEVEFSGAAAVPAG